MLSTIATSTSTASKDYDDALELLNQEFNIYCSCCCDILPTFSCPHCNLQQCLLCIKNFIEMNLSKEELFNIPFNSFPCIQCKLYYSMEMLLFDTESIVSLTTTILNKKHRFDLIEIHKRHEKELQKLEDGGHRDTEFYKNKFSKLLSMFTPCCAMAFDDFDACAAIHCDFCHNNFCALCLDFVIQGTTHDDLIDFDAKQEVSIHKHVKSCKFNLHFKNSFFVKQWYPKFCQASRFAYQWNDFCQNRDQLQVDQLYDFILPLTKDSNIFFNSKRSCFAKLLPHQQLELDNTKKRKRQHAPGERRRRRRNDIIV